MGKLLYGKIDESRVIHKFTSKLPSIGQKLSMNLVWSGKVNRFTRHRLTHPFHKVAADWVGGSIEVVIDKIPKVDPRTGRTKTSRKSRTVYNKGNVEVDCPVELWFVYKFRTRPLDSGNCQAMSKVFEDGMVRCGYMDNDTNEFVTWVGNLSVPMGDDERFQMDYDTVELYVTSTEVTGK